MTTQPNNIGQHKNTCTRNITTKTVNNIKRTNISKSFKNIIGGSKYK